MSAKQQQGTTTVEFAIVGLVTLVLLFVVIEFGRIFFSLNVLDESVRRAARIAAVCPVGDAAIGDAATFVGLPESLDHQRRDPVPGRERLACSATRAVRTTPRSSSCAYAS